MTRDSVSRSLMGLAACLALLTPISAQSDDDSPVRPELACSTDDDCVLAQRCCGCPLEMRARNRQAAAEEDDRCARRVCRSCAETTPPQPVGARCQAGQCVAIEATEVAPAAPYRYEPATGRCVDGDGNDGRNEVDLARIAATGDADCVDLSDRDLYDEAQSLEATIDFEHVSFRGSNLVNVVFPPYGAPAYNTPLQGADVRGAEDVYGMPLQGVIDDHTRYDETCIVSESDGQRHIDCPRETP